MNTQCSSRSSRGLHPAPFTVLLLLFPILSAPGAKLLYVAPDGGHLPPFNSWANAATNIQDALDEADDGDTVRVTNGTYNLTAELTITNGLTLESVNGAGATILDGNDVTRCVYMDHLDAVINGFTVTRGLALDGGGIYMNQGGEVSDCTIVSNRVFSSGTIGANVHGGGLFINGGGTLRHSMVLDNFSSGNWHAYGGGIYCQSGGTIQECHIIGNSVTGRFYEVFGGGVFLNAGGDLSQCLISSNVSYSSWNTTDAKGGGLYALSGGSVSESTLSANSAYYGGGFFLRLGGGHVDRCNILRNGASDGGGGYLDNGGEVERCLIQGNQSQYNGGLSINGGSVHECDIVGNHAANSGGGLFAYNTTVENCLISSNTVTWFDSGGVSMHQATLRNCLITDNTAGTSIGEGGGVGSQSGSIQNCTLLRNNATHKGGGIHGTADIENSIIYFNTSPLNPNLNLVGGTVNHTCAIPRPAGTNNTGADPELMLGGPQDAGLLPGSPCLNTGTNATWMAGAKDLKGSDRIIDGQVDMGCFELEPGPLACNPVANQTEGFAPFEVVFTAFVEGTNTTSLFYWWDIDLDGSWDYTGAGLGSVTQVYSGAGYRSIALMVSNAAGETAYMEKADYINLAPAIAFVSLHGSHTYPFTNWATAATNIQAAVDAGVDTTVIVVSNGLFTLASEIFIDKAVTVQGFKGPSGSIVDGNHSTRCFNLAHPDAVIDGLTIQRGAGVNAGGGVYASEGGTVRNCRIRENSSDNYGGGVHLFNNGLLEDSLVVSNHAYYGGGVYLEKRGRVSNCTIISNRATYGGGLYTEDFGNVIEGCTVNTNMAEYYGGAVYFYEGSNVLQDCTLIANSAGEYGGGVYIEGEYNTIDSCVVNSNTAYYDGGGMYVADYYTEIRDSTIHDNRTSDSGGGVYFYYGYNLMERCSISGNYAEDYGGGVYLYDSVMQRCTIRDNTADSDGGGLYADYGYVTNCLVAGNTSGATGGGVYLSDGTLQNCTIGDNTANQGGGIYSGGGVLRNTIVYYNTAPTGPNHAGGGSSWSTSCTTPAVSGPGNLTGPPLFADWPAGNFRIISGSPCIDSGEAPDAPGVDIEGTTRPLDGDSSSTAEYDMGAYEYEDLPADLDTDGDGLTDVEELYIYGTNREKPDTDGDGQNDGEEVIAATDPLNPDEYFAIYALDPNPAGAGMVFSWLSDTQCVYTVRTDTGLNGGWVVVPGHENLPGTGATMTYTNDAAANGSTYYCIGVRRAE